MPTRRRIALPEGRAAVAAWLAAQPHQQRDGDLQGADHADSRATLPAVDRATIATAVRYTLEELNARAPGQALEVRVPPFGATQCIEGPRHTRGTPPGVVEMSPEIWLAVATGRREWDEALASGDVSASGERANLSALLPLTDA
ncbi:sterol carrier family protein [Demequina aurantiaca]|uniref:sterol carrier family protein n=1 Tax=Demequina aurantiaca TaxID=676200 RepID=UPI00078268E6|nr:sterol carrier family protein [Demequina aurantiaca]